MKRAALIAAGIPLAIFAYVTIGLIIVHHRTGTEFSYRNAGTDLTFMSSDGAWSDSENLLRGRHFEQIVLAHELYKIKCHRPESRLLRTKPRKRPWNWAYWFDDYEDLKWRVPEAAPLAHSPAQCDSQPPDALQTAQATRAAGQYMAGLSAAGP